MNEYFFPELQTVETLTPYCLRTTWSTGEVLDVDVESILRKHADLQPVLEPEAFSRAHIGEWGNSIEWFARRVRKRLGLTQTEFSLRIGVSVETIRNWEQGKRRPIIILPGISRFIIVLLTADFILTILPEE